VSRHIQAQLLPVEGGELYLRVQTPMTVPITQALIISQAFAEEMNKSRRQMALLAQTLAEQGVATILYDGFGTGESSGELCSVAWQHWQVNLLSVDAWARLQWPSLPVAHLGHRLGALLVASTDLPTGRRVYWQPVYNGEQALTQFLRISVAMSAMRGQTTTTQQLRAQASAEGHVEVAGYRLAHRLIAAIDALKLSAYPISTPTLLLECQVTEPPLEQSPALDRYCSQVAGIEHLRSDVVAANHFWAAQEISTAPELIGQTVDWLTAT
jgi:uncharacterized protein